MIGVGIYKQLTSNSDISNLIGGRLYPVRLPKNPTFPLGVWRLQPNGSINVLGGEDETRTNRLQLDWYAEDYSVTRRLLDLSRAVLVPVDGANGYPYTLPDGTGVMAVMVHGDEDENFEVSKGGYVFRSMLDLEVTYKPAN